MTLNGYYFTATGITEYAFYHGDKSILSVVHDSLPDTPVRIRSVSGAEYAFARPFGWNDAPYERRTPVPGASFPFLDQNGGEAGWLYLLGANHFAVAVPGAALDGRIIHCRPHRSVCLTGLDDEPVAQVALGLERIPTRERFGEWFPRRYVAEIESQPDETLLSLALCAPFLGFDALEMR